MYFNVAVTRNAATLDTKPLAKSYSGGIRTHLFSNHFQYARAPHSYVPYRSRADFG